MSVTQPGMQMVLVLDNIRSAWNVGSIFRTADAFSVSRIYLCGITACPPHREILKTALGATESVPWKYVAKTMEAIHELKKQGYALAAVEQSSRSILLSHFSPAAHQVLILGNEINGVNKEILALCDSIVEIPQHGIKRSLNVAVCAGIVLWECCRNRC
jgi:tRNA G18 (ribose-2'-O)-methylase SpoU